MNDVEKGLESVLIDWGVSATLIPYTRLLILISIVGIISGILFYIKKKYVIKLIYRFFKKTSFTWDDALADHKVFNNVAHIVPAIIIRISAPIIFSQFEALLPIVIKLVDIYLIIVGMLILMSFLKAGEYLLAESKLLIDKPVASYFQLLRIVIYIATSLLVISVMISKSPVYLLSAFGALSAIILLIFKDTILGLVASVQISSNDMVRVGDWVEMPKFNADGDVVAINLNTVKIQNWDKTVTTVPTYFFITDSFKNWRGMQESGGRRIKRSVYINVHSIKFVDPELREKFKKNDIIRDYVSERQAEIEAHNSTNNVDTSELINGRRMTNIGVFRKYLELYLTRHKDIRKDMTLLVRQMTLEDRGIPIELYCFTNTTKWAEYEEIQSFIFDHILAAVNFFELDVFQNPGGSDIVRALSERK